MDIFKNCKPMVAKWLPFGQHEVFNIDEKTDTVSYYADKYGEGLTVWRNEKPLFSMYLDNNMPKPNAEDIRGIIACRYIKCDVDEVPIVEDNKCSIITRIVELLPV